MNTGTGGNYWKLPKQEDGREQVLFQQISGSASQQQPTGSLSSLSVEWGNTTMPYTESIKGFCPRPGPIPLHCPSAPRTSLFKVFHAPGPQLFLSISYFSYLFSMAQNSISKAIPYSPQSIQVLCFLESLV